MPRNISVRDQDFIQQLCVLLSGNTQNVRKCNISEPQPSKTQKVPIICHIVTRVFEDKAMFIHLCFYCIPGTCMAYTYTVCVAVMFRRAYCYCIHVRACILFCKETWQTMMSCAVTKFHANILSREENLGNFFLLSLIHTVYE